VGGSRGELIEAKWGALGPDAAGIGARVLRERLGGARRGLKAALMDQGVVAGLGNIYTDESLHRAGLSPVRRAGSLRAEEHEALHRARLSPVRPAGSLRAEEHAALARAVRATLRAGVRGGGSSLRDGAYVNGRGEAGSFQTRHRVYGRGGEPCLACGATLRTGRVVQRTTVWCPKCQR